jgi:hypothetical protein
LRIEFRPKTRDYIVESEAMDWPVFADVGEGPWVFRTFEAASKWCAAVERRLTSGTLL